jgi:hypothetical protein
MKTMLFACCFFCATAACAQTASVLNNTPSPMFMAEHPLHAGEHSMRPADNLLGDSAYGYAQGEQPLADFATAKRETPLGDLAREQRRIHSRDRKAVKVASNQ